MGGEKDFNVPLVGERADVSGAAEPRDRHAARDLPGQFHGITLPSYRVDRLERWVGWFDAYLKPGGAAPPATSTSDGKQ